MRNRQLLAATVVMSLLGTAWAVADEVRFYEQDGVTYRETRRTVQRPVSETRMEQTTRTVYRQECTSELRKTSRTWWTPVTEYCCQPYLVGRWNPFVVPYYSYRYVPRTRWCQRTEQVDMPVTCCRCVPHTQTVQVPVTTRRMACGQVISRVAVSGRSFGVLEPIPQSPTLAKREQIGGLARLDKDPPRHGVSTAWRAVGAR